MTNLQEHKFEVYILILENHDSMEMILEIWNVYEIDLVMNSRLHFLNRA